MKPALIIAAILCLGFFITDCTTGNDGHDEAVVTGRYYKPPWTQIVVSSDGDGGVDVDTIDHPEEWHTTVTVGTSSRDYNAGKTLYLCLTNGQFVTIKHKVGKWTGIKYIGTITP